MGGTTTLKKYTIYVGVIHNPTKSGYEVVAVIRKDLFTEEFPNGFGRWKEEYERLVPFPMQPTYPKGFGIPLDVGEEQVIVGNVLVKPLAMGLAHRVLERMIERGWSAERASGYYISTLLKYC